MGDKREEHCPGEQTHDDCLEDIWRKRRGEGEDQSRRGRRKEGRRYRGDGRRRRKDEQSIK